MGDRVRQLTLPWSERPGLPARDTRARWDIQGLRAFAVLAVVVDHLTGWPGGGLVGVDVFFVISGFLITDLLQREHERTGRISVVGFYRRRIKRILPAAVVVLVVTVALARSVFLEDRWRSTLTDSVWALLFSSNWRFWSQSTDYFAADGPTSPLQHYWSLSIEEQFYFVWPGVMLVLFAILLRGRSHRSARLVVLVAISLITLGSFAWAVLQTQDSPAQAYFSTFTRVWELGLGAALAVVVPWVAQLPERLRVPMAWTGLLGMVASLWVVDGEAGFPAPAAALPVVATALVIAAGTRADGEQQRRLWPLTNRASGYVGDVSYSMYLWHFPIIILLGAAIGASGWRFYTFASVATVLTTVASYHLVEQPLRRSPFLDSFPTRRARASAFAAWWGTWRRTYATAGMAVLVLVTVSLVQLAVTPAPAPVTAGTVDYSAADEADTAGVVEAGTMTPGETQLDADLTAALRVTSWPDNLTPSLSELDTEGRPEESQECYDNDPSDPSLCSFGNPDDPTMVILGDSTGITLLPTVRTAYGDDYFIRGLSLVGCPVSVDKVYESTDLATRCVQHRKDAIAEIQRIRPQVVFVISAYGVVDELASGAQGSAAIDEWRAGQQATIDQIRTSVDDIVLVSSAPRGPLLEDCATKISAPVDCVYQPPDSYEDVVAADVSISNGKVHSYDTLGWFCTSYGDCPPFVGNTVLKRDQVHTTPQWAEIVAPLFKERVDPWLAPK